jgi:hypothetical protein
VISRGLAFAASGPTRVERTAEEGPSAPRQEVPVAAVESVKCAVTDSLW